MPGDPASLLQAAVFARINYSLIIIFRISQSPSKGAIRPLEEILRPLQPFFTFLLRSLSSIDEKSSSTSDVTPNLKPIKSQVYGDLTCQEAAEIIVNSKEQFEMLKYELRVAGVCTTLAAQQLLLQSHLQARFNEIDAQWREEEDNGSAEEVQLSKIDDSMLQPSCPPPSRHS